MTRRNGPESSETSLYLSLSLYILLLAFFAVLTSIVSFDDHKVSQALNSLERSFSLIGEGRIAGDRIDDHSAGLQGEGQIVEIIEEIFRSEIDVQTEKEGESGSLLRVEMAASDLFDAEGNLTGAATRSFDAVGEALSASRSLASLPGDLQFELDIVMSGSEAGMRSGSLAVASLATRMIAGGADPEALSISYDTGEASQQGQVMLFLRLVPKGQPVINPVRQSLGVSPGQQGQGR